MSHLDPDDLAVLALDEGGRDAAETAALREHLDTCTDCREQYDGLRDIVRLGRTSLDAPAATLLAPPPSVWARVAADAGVQPTAGAPHEQSPRPARDPRWSRFAAGAAGVLVGAAATVAVALVVTSDDPQPPSPSAETPGSTAPGEDVLARTRLAALPGQQAQGEAVLAERGSARLLDVSLTRDDGPGFTEVWLFEPGTTRMVSLGVLDGGRGSFVVPPALDLDRYVGVDVSQERYDGNPARGDQPGARAAAPVVAREAAAVRAGRSRSPRRRSAHR